MIWLLDNNLSYRLAQQIRDGGIDCVHVSDIGLKHADDKEIFDYAARHNHVLISKDDDFLDLSLLYGRPPLVVKLEVGNINTSLTLSVLLRDKLEIDAAERDIHIQILRIYKLKPVLDSIS